MLLLLLCLIILAETLSQPTKVGIINGTNANIEDFPWMVTVYDVDEFICGGSLISPNWALTAGHCSEYHQILKIRAGSSNRTDDKGTFFEVAEVLRHPNFTRKSDGTTLNDLTLIHLKSSANGTTITPIRLPELDTPLPEGQSINISGWGDTTGQGMYPVDLKFTTIEIPTVESCIEAYKNYNYIVDPAGEFCAGTIGESKGTCRGDSGSPAEINGTILGMVSWGLSGCSTTKMPVVLVNVIKYRSWIQTVTGL